MTIGRGSSVRSGKVEPKSRAISPAAADQLGQATAFAKPQLHGKTIGVKAPPHTSTPHKCGSQGRH